MVMLAENGEQTPKWRVGMLILLRQ
jgi:hypothetical protein